ncbi:hypothetical protein [Bacillus sp. 3255]|nr:hypothetical protein [Bacillus sp. 3255]
MNNFIRPVSGNPQFAIGQALRTQLSSQRIPDRNKVHGQVAARRAGAD